MMEKKDCSPFSRLLLILIILFFSYFIVLNFDKETFFRDETTFILTGKLTYDRLMALDFGSAYWSDWLNGAGYNVPKLPGLIMWIFILFLAPDEAANLDIDQLLQHLGEVYPLNDEIVTAARVPGVILGIISLLAIYSITKRVDFNEISNKKGYIGIIMLSTNSIILFHMRIAISDIYALSFLSLSLLFLIKSKECAEDFSGHLKLKFKIWLYFILSAFFGGLCVASKLNTAIVFILLLAVLLFPSFSLFHKVRKAIDSEKFYLILVSVLFFILTIIVIFGIHILTFEIFLVIISILIIMVIINTILLAPLFFHHKRFKSINNYLKIWIAFSIFVLEVGILVWAVERSFKAWKTYDHELIVNISQFYNMLFVGFATIWVMIFFYNKLLLPISDGSNDVSIYFKEFLKKKLFPLLIFSIIGLFIYCIFNPYFFKIEAYPAFLSGMTNLRRYRLLTFDTVVFDSVLEAFFHWGNILFGRMCSIPNYLIFPIVIILTEKYCEKKFKVTIYNLLMIITIIFTVSQLVVFISFFFIYTIYLYLKDSRNQPEFLTVCIGLLIISFALLGYFSYVLWTRWAIPTIISMIIIATYGLEKFIDSFSKKESKILFSISFFITCSAIFVFNPNYQYLNSLHLINNPTSFLLVFLGIIGFLAASLIDLNAMMREN